MYTAPLLAWFAEKRQRRAELAATKTADESDVGVVDSEKDAELPKSHWDRKKARLDYERALYKFEVEKKKYLPPDEIRAAVGQMLAGFRTALNMLPSSAARWLVGLRDFHAIKAKLEAEVDAVLGALGRCEYLGDIAPRIVARLFSDRDAQFRDELVRACNQVFQEIGRDISFRSSATIASYNIGAGRRSHTAAQSRNDPVRAATTTKEISGISFEPRGSRLKTGR